MSGTYDPRAAVEALLVTELFPPMVGGSSELFANVYSRLDPTPVTVLCDLSQAAARSPSAPGGSGDPQGVTALAHPHDRLERVRVLRERRPTRDWGLLHLNGLRPHASNAARLRRLSAGKRVVMHCGRALPEGLDALMARPLGGAPYVCWTHGEELTYVRASRELTLLMHLVHARAARLIANSRNTASMLEAFGADPSNVDVVYPGVDVDQFHPGVPGAAAIRQRFVDGDEILLLTVGRLQRRKGHDLVLKSLPAVLAAFPALRYVIVGDGEERAALEEMATGLGVRARVTFVGKVPATELAAYYAAADVFVHPNRIEGEDFEGFGIVFLEAAAAGLPVIAGNTGGAPEAVLDGSTGVLVSGTSTSELTRVIVDLVRAPHVRRDMGAHGRIRVSRDFSWTRAAERVADIHAHVASASAR